jgi:hypothetical protein
MRAQRLKEKVFFLPYFSPNNRLERSREYYLR